jgi:hypothetical protein
VREHNIVDIEVQDTHYNYDNDDDDSSDDENEGDDIDENAFPDAGVFEGTLTNMEGVGDQAIIDCWKLPGTSVALIFLRKSTCPSSFTLRTLMSSCKRASISPFLQT